MPTTHTVTLYTIYELPTDEAKSRARNWWREAESQDPAWLGEFQDSLKYALQTLEALDREDPEAISLAIKEHEDLDPTGFFADAILADLLTADPHTTPAQVREAYDKAWQDDRDGRNDDQWVDETLDANGYTFLESGERFG